MSQYTHFDVQQQGNITEIRLVNTKFYDASDYAFLQSELKQFIEAEKPQNLLVHFDQIQYCSTAVMNGLLDVRNAQLSGGRQLKLCGMSDDVRDAFRMLKLDGRVFEIYLHQGDAVAAF